MDARNPLRCLSTGLGRAWAAALLIATVAGLGCEDASNVGVGLVGEEEPPRAVTVPARDVESTSFSPVSGNRRQILVGRVSDPLFGEVRTRGYVDLSSPTEKPELFSNPDSSVTEVTFRLWGPYAYGDTTDSVNLVLRAMNEEWQSQSRHADTTLSAGEVVAETTFAAGADTVTISLPDRWIADHEELLQGSPADFNTDFHGFELSAPDGGVVRGFRADSSRMTVTVADSVTLPFPVTRELVTAERLSEPNVPEGRTYLQAATGPALSLRVDLSADSLSSMVLNRFRLTVPVDRAAMEESTPSGFARPLPTRLSLFAVQPDGEQVHLETGSMREDGNAYVFDTPSLTSALQDVILDKEQVDHFLVGGSAADPIDLGALMVVRDVPGKSEGPRVRMTVLPAQN